MSESANRTPPGPESPGENGESQFAAFSRIWTDTCTRMMQLATTFTPENAPPEMIRQMRSSLFQALSQSWEDYLRSPQFMESTKQWIEQVVNMRQMTNDCLTRMHHEMQGVPRQDIDAVLLSVRHLERRVLDRLEQIESRLDAVSPPGRPKTKKAGKPAPEEKRSDAT